MTDDQRVIYAGLVALRNTEATLRWTQTQIFFLVHSAGISLVITQFDIGSILYSGACIVGIAVGVSWVMTIRRSSRWLDYWDAGLAALERHGPQPIVIFGTRQYREAKVRNGLESTLLSLACAFMVVWIGMTTLSALTLFYIGGR